jgi:pimeloyl-ACP methyl ester carboxylesterase
MKKYIYFIFLLFYISQYSYSQTPENAGAIRQKISIKQYQGKKIEIQASVKVNQLENISGAALFFKVQRENKEVGATLFSKTPIIKNSWNIYSLRGTLDTDADSLTFGGYFQGKAIYSFDNFILNIDGETIPINDNNFETYNQFPNNIWTAPLWPKGFVISYAKENPYDGKQSLVIDGSNVRKINKIGDNDSTGKFAEINGIRLYYEIYGAGEPLLLLHGNQQSIEVFKNQILEFSKLYKVIAVDTRGQGKSTTDNKNYTYDLFAEDMNLLLEYLKIESANIVGWSDGGNTGLILAMKHPTKVKKLVTMGACIFIDKTVVNKNVFREVNNRITELNKDSSAQKINSSKLYTMLLNEPKHNFEELKLISCPTLIIAGENDIIKTEHTKEIAAHIGNSKLIIASKETHEYPVENPDSFNKVVLDFLNSK